MMLLLINRLSIAKGSLALAEKNIDQCLNLLSEYAKTPVTEGDRADEQYDLFDDYSVMLHDLPTEVSE